MVRRVRSVVRFSLALACLLVLAVPSAMGENERGNRVQILCGNDDGSEYRPKERPKQCVIFGPNGIFAGGINLKKIHWESWGGGRAKGSGIECGFHLPCADIQAEVTARRPRERCGRVVYTRIKAETRYGKATPRPPGCPGPAY